VFGLAFAVAFVPKSQKPTKGPNLARSFFSKSWLARSVKLKADLNPLLASFEWKNFAIIYGRTFGGFY
jgi:hypothetical protein